MAYERHSCVYGMGINEHVLSHSYIDNGHIITYSNEISFKILADSGQKSFFLQSIFELGCTP